MKDISIQIINYHSLTDIERLLPQLLKDLDGTDIDYEIHILDNNSREDLEPLRRHAPHRINTHYSESNTGFGNGHNTLATKTDATYLLISNTDLTLNSPQCVQTMFEILETKPDVAACSPQLLTSAGKPQPFDHTHFWWSKAALHPLELFLWRPVTTIRECATIAGAFMLIKRAAFNKVGGFDPQIFFYFEDNDLCFRLRKEKYRLLYVGTHQMLHATSFSRRKFEYYRSSLRYILNKHFPQSLFSKLLIALFTYLPVYWFIKMITWKGFINEEKESNN